MKQVVSDGKLNYVERTGGPMQPGCHLTARDRLFALLAERGVTACRREHLGTGEAGIIMGTSDERRIQLALKAAGAKLCGAPESFVIDWIGNDLLLVAGSDGKGLMYALNELADRLEADAGALSKLLTSSSTPYNRVRGVDRYVLGHLDDEWLRSERFWDVFFAKLSRERFNRFCLIFGFDTAMYSPPYPYFLEVPSFRQVKAAGLSEGARDANLNNLRMIADKAHAFGLEFIFSTWQQTPWTNEQGVMVENLPRDADELAEYCHDGIYELLTRCPQLDGVQFRVNHESGVGTQVSADDFWMRCIDAVGEAARKTGKRFKMDLRAKGLSDGVTEHALNQGLDVAIPTKYWCEHTALPYHISLMRTEELNRLGNLNAARRYSYADLLRKPRLYDVIYRLWNYGSTNLFIWSDPDYAARFSRSCAISGSDGFEVNSPLSLKYGDASTQTERWDVFADASLRSGEFEDDRHWLFYTLFGRLGYDPCEPSETWERALRARYGGAAGALLRGLGASGKIMPLITTVHMPIHPSILFWPELSTGGALFAGHNLNLRFKDTTYGSAEASDHGLFYGIDEFAEAEARASFDGRYTPPQYAAMLSALARETKAALAELNNFGEASAELNAARADMTMLVSLALYHAHKIEAALELKRWFISKESARLAASYRAMLAAHGSFAELAADGLKYYNNPLEFGTNRSPYRRGTWNDLLPELDADLGVLKKMCEEAVSGFGSDENEPCLNVTELDAVPPLGRFALDAAWPDEHTAGSGLELAVRSGGAVAPRNVTLRYRRLNQLDGPFKTLAMEFRDGAFRAVIPGDEFSAEWDMLVYATAADADGTSNVFPGVWHPSFPWPYHVINVKA